MNDNLGIEVKLIQFLYLNCKLESLMNINKVGHMFNNFLS